MYRRFRKERIIILVLLGIIFILFNLLIFSIYENSKLCINTSSIEYVEVFNECPEIDIDDILNEHCNVEVFNECPEINEILNEHCTIEFLNYSNKDLLVVEFENDTIDDEDFIRNLPRSQRMLLLDAAEDYAEYFISEDIDNIYEMMPDKSRKNISSINFIQLFKPVVYGVRHSYLESGDVFSRVNSMPYLSILVKDVKINDTIAFVDFSKAKLNHEIIPSSKLFVLENESWKLVGLNYLVYGGCFYDIDCEKNSEVLNPICEELCEDFRFMKVNSEEPYNCKDNFCHCNCWSDANNFGTYLKPDFDDVNRVSLGLK